MELTYPLRRKKVNSDPPMTLQTIKENWPTLFLEKEVKQKQPLSYK